MKNKDEEKSQKKIMMLLGEMMIQK